LFKAFTKCTCLTPGQILQSYYIIGIAEWVISLKPITELEIPDLGYCDGSHNSQNDPEVKASIGFDLRRMEKILDATF
jgi:hypothetical protein